MRRAKYKKNRKLPPHILEYYGPHTQVAISMQLFVYSEDSFFEYTDLTWSQLKSVIEKSDSKSIKWFNLHGLHNVELLNEIGVFFGVEKYVIGEILNYSRRSRIEELENGLFFTIKSLIGNEGAGAADIEQVSFVLKDNVLLSFQEKKNDLFDWVRERIRTKMGSIRKKDEGFLLYMLLDAILENYFVTMDQLEDRIEQVLWQSREAYNRSVLDSIEKESEVLNTVKRSIVPLKDVLHNLKSRNEDKSLHFIEPSNALYFARLHYKVLELLDQIDYNLLKLDSATNYFFSAQNHRMNEIMKLLTIVSVIFIPLTFIVGVYGMNFDNMPELHAPYGYYLTWAIMLFLVLGMVLYFRKRRWF